MGQDAPALTDLNRPLKDHLQSLETPPAAAKPAAVPRARARRPHRPRRSPKSRNDADAKKVLRQMQELARKVTKYWLSKDVADARAYRLGRAAGLDDWWNRHRPTPTALTQIPAPAPERIKQFETQRQAGQLEALLPELGSDPGEGALLAGRAEARGRCAGKPWVSVAPRPGHGVAGTRAFPGHGAGPTNSSSSWAANPSPTTRPRNGWRSTRAPAKRSPRAGKRAKKVDAAPWDEAYQQRPCQRHLRQPGCGGQAVDDGSTRRPAPMISSCGVWRWRSSWCRPVTPTWPRRSSRPWWPG